MCAQLVVLSIYTFICVLVISLKNDFRPSWHAFSSRTLMCTVFSRADQSPPVHKLSVSLNAPILLSFHLNTGFFEGLREKLTFCKR